MLLSPVPTGVFNVPLKARHQPRVPSQGVGVKDGLGISPLRATSGPPSISQAVPQRTSSLVKPPQAGGCLLYTSPSPRDRSLSRMPSSA